MNRPTTDETSRLTQRVDYHVDRLVTQCERFDRMADRLQPWATRWSTDDLAADLSEESTRRRRERRLVILALKATARTGRIIDNYEPPRDSSDHPLFYRVVRIEWERRYRNDDGEVTQVA